MARETGHLCLIQLPAPFLRDEAMLPPLGLLYVAAGARRAEWTVSLERDLKWSAGADLYGMGPTTAQWESTKLMARAIDAPVVIGGPHVSALAEVAHTETGRTIVIGEGDRFECWHDGEGIVKPPAVENLDDLPFPAWDLWGMAGRTEMTIHTARGCPYHCAFCSHSVFGYKVRRRSVASVVAEIDTLIRDYGIRRFRFLDDTFTLDQKWCFALCEQLAGRGVTWRCQTRADCTSKQLFAMLWRGGCRQIDFGLETACEYALALCRKGESAEDIRIAAQEAKAAGFRIKVFLIEGLPGDDPIETLDWMADVRPHEWTLSQFTPLPGSELWHGEEPADFRLDRQTTFRRELERIMR